MTTVVSKIESKTKNKYKNCSKILHHAILWKKENGKWKYIYWAGWDAVGTVFSCKQENRKWKSFI